MWDALPPRHIILFSLLKIKVSLLDYKGPQNQTLGSRYPKSLVRAKHDRVG